MENNINCIQKAAAHLFAAEVLSNNPIVKKKINCDMKKLNKVLSQYKIRKFNENKRRK
jgi:hypothetical protein